MSIFASVFYIQLLIMLTLMNMYVPDKVSYILVKCKPATLDFDWLYWAKFPWLESNGNYLEELDFAQPHVELGELGYTSGSFVINEFNVLKAFILMVLLNICFLPFMLL